MTLRAYLDKLPSLGEGVYVDPTALVIGDVTVGAHASLWPMTVVRGDVNHIRIGARSNVQDGSVLHVSRPFPGREAGWPLEVGEEVTIGHQVVIHGCTIGNRCLIGMGAILMDGAVTGDESIVGAGSLVPAGRRIPPRTLWIGSPARLSRALTDEEVAYLAESAAHYVALKDDYLAR